MAWLRIDDRVRTHPKIALAGPAAAWLWFCGVCYCREHLTDGFLPKAVIPTLALNLPSPWKHAAKLVEVNLWEDAIGGFQVHDFLQWNPSKADVLTNRMSEADRKRTERGRPKGQTPESSRVRAGDAGSGSLSGSVVLGSSGESAREPSRGPAPLIDGRDVRRHGSHAWCDWERGLCVQPGQHAEFIRRLGGEDADARLRAWYPTVIAKYAGRPIGDDVFAFWNHEFAAWVGTVTTKPATVSATPDRAAKTLTAAEKVIQRQLDARQRALTP